MSEPQDDFGHFIVAARRGLRRREAADPAALAPTPAFATRVAARWSASKPESWLLVALERCGPWTAAAAIALCLGVAGILHDDFGPGARLADALAVFVNHEGAVEPF